MVEFLIYLFSCIFSAFVAICIERFIALTEDDYTLICKVWSKSRMSRFLIVKMILIMFFTDKVDSFNILYNLVKLVKGDKNRCITVDLDTYYRSGLPYFTKDTPQCISVEERLYTFIDDVCFPTETFISKQIANLQFQVNGLKKPNKLICEINIKEHYNLFFFCTEVILG